MIDDILQRLVWLGHDGFRIGGSPTIYFDPWKLNAFAPADIILVSHEHYDHMSVEDIRKLCKANTVIVTCHQAAAQLSGDVRPMKPGDRLSVSSVMIEAVPAYNVNKFRAPGQPFHRKVEAKLGFVVTVGGVRIYHAGDTDLIPEMSTIRADIALLPVSGKYVMTAEEAAEAAKLIQPQVAIPMHYGEIVGSIDDAERFQRVAPVTVHILAKE